MVPIIIFFCFVFCCGFFVFVFVLFFFFSLKMGTVEQDGSWFRIMSSLCFVKIKGFWYNLNHILMSSRIPRNKKPISKKKKNKKKKKKKKEKKKKKKKLATLSMLDVIIINPPILIITLMLSYCTDPQQHTQHKNQSHLIQTPNPHGFP